MYILSYVKNTSLLTVIVIIFLNVLIACLITHLNNRETVVHGTILTS